MPDLELIPTADLIAELMHRHSFLGVVLQAQEEMRQGWESERHFLVHFNSNLSQERVKSLLRDVADGLERLSSHGKE